MIFHRKPKVYHSEILITDTEDKLFDAINRLGNINSNWWDFYYDLCGKIYSKSLFCLSGEPEKEECRWEEFLDKHHVNGYHDYECPKHTRKFLLPNEIYVEMNPVRNGLVMANIKIRSTKKKTALIDEVLQDHDIIYRTKPLTNQDTLMLINIVNKHAN